MMHQVFPNFLDFVADYINLFVHSIVVSAIVLGKIIDLFVLLGFYPPPNGEHPADNGDKNTRYN
jgi:hypothetical protein